MIQLWMNKVQKSKVVLEERISIQLETMACAGFQSWQQSVLLGHASESVKHQHADAHLMKEIKCMEKESLESDAIDMLMQLPGAVSGYSCSSSMSLPE